jgi:hypothetical protein
MSQRWTTVFHGSMVEAIVCRGLLESNEVPVRILDENIKVIDPFMTGANALGIQLQVPTERESEAREMLDYRPPPEERPEPKTADEQSVRAIANRIRWCSIMGLTAPIALLSAPAYFAGVKRLGRSPDEHRWTIASLVLSAVLVLIFLSFALGR